jgi:hypothetical protein
VQRGFDFEDPHLGRVWVQVLRGARHARTRLVVSVAYLQDADLLLGRADVRAWRKDRPAKREPTTRSEGGKMPS